MLAGARFFFFFLFLACLHTAFYSQHSHEACGFFGLRLIGHPSYISPFGVSPLTICNLFFFLFHIISISEAFLIFHLHPPSSSLPPFSFC